MTDRQEVGGSPRALAGTSTPRWSNPVSEAVHAWLNDFARAAKSFRVYADNNEMLNRFVDRAFRGLEVILQSTPELNLSVRADRLLLGKDAVHVNADRDDGLPFTLYRNAFRRITFLQGFQRTELVEFMRALSADYTGGTEQLGDDLVAALWRMALPHLRYVTIDAFSVTTTDHQPAESADPGERVEIERIQESVEDIVAAIYRTNAPDDDIVAGVSITKEDLEAFRRIREETLEDLDDGDHATARIITEVTPEEVEVFAASLERDTRDALVHRIVDILIHILFRDPSGEDSARTIGLIQQLFDSMVLARRFADATELVERLRITGGRSENRQEAYVARHLIRMFASEQRIMSVVEALEERSASVQDKVRFLRALGPDTRSVLLDSLDRLSQPGHRRLLIELIREFGAPPLDELHRRMSTAKWFVVRDLLSLSQAYPLERMGPVIIAGLGHEHPKVRQHAVGLLRGYGPGLADKLLAQRLNDEDSEVRLAAMRIAAARKSLASRRVLEAVLESEELYERGPKELRTLMAAYAAIAGVSAIPALDRVLNPGFFSRFKGTEPQMAAAFALASIGPAAHEVLQRGARTLNSRVRDACRRAMNSRDSADLPAILLGTPDSPPPGGPVPDLTLPSGPDDREAPAAPKVIPGQALSEGPGGPAREPNARGSNTVAEPRSSGEEGPAWSDLFPGQRELVPEDFAKSPADGRSSARDPTASMEEDLRAYLDGMKTSEVAAFPRRLSRPKVDDLLLEPPTTKGSAS